MVLGFMMGMIIAWIVIIALGILAFIFWLLMLIDCASRSENDFKNKGDRIVWIIVIVLTGIIGAAIYYFVVKAPSKKRKAKRKRKRR